METTSAEAIEQELTAFKHSQDTRDDLVHRAETAGISKHRIHLLSGLARTTVDRILEAKEN